MYQNINKIQSVSADLAKKAKDSRDKILKLQAECKQQAFDAIRENGGEIKFYDFDYRLGDHDCLVSDTTDDPTEYIFGNDLSVATDYCDRDVFALAVRANGKTANYDLWDDVNNVLYEKVPSDHVYADGVELLQMVADRLQELEEYN